MNNTEGYTSNPSLVCNLQKSLYGLKQAPRSWYAKMDAFVLSQNFHRWKYDPNVYYQQYEHNIMIIVLYVYDILITGSTLASIAFINTALHDAFEMSDLGLLKQFLGIEISQDGSHSIETTSHDLVIRSFWRVASRKKTGRWPHDLSNSSHFSNCKRLSFLICICHQLIHFIVCLCFN